MERCLEALGDERFPDVEHRPGVTSDEVSNLVIRFVGMEQDVGMPDCGRGGFTAVDDRFKE